MTHNHRMTNPLRLLLLCLLFSFGAAQSQTSSGLWVCQRNGSTAIVGNKDHTPDCKPYQKGMLGEGSSLVAPKKELTPPTTATPTGFTNLSTGERIDLDKIDQDALGASVHKQLNPKAHSKTTTPSVNSNDIYIYYCPDSNGGSMLEAKTPPKPSCRSVGKKAILQDPLTAQAPANKETKLSTFKHGKSEISIGTSDAPPTDIYKCFDENARPSYVPETETHNKRYRHCSFFSRSFASVQADFRKRLTQPKTLTELATQGVSGKAENTEPLSSAAVRCVGAGSVEFNGSSRDYNCATRSFDLTPGTSGGQVVLGNKTATIAAHNLDYFNSGGRCGGSVTTPEGRILHLAPTKDCPVAFQIEAREIEQAYIKTISVNVSGAFLERQRQLSAQVNQIANRIGIDPFLVHAIISAESAYKVRARSHVGAMGLMQLMPATARRFGVTDAYHTGENIRGGATYLKFLLNKFNGNYQLAIAGYNAGEGNVIKYGYKIPPFIETRAYVPKVMEYYRRYKANPSLIGLP